MATGGKLAQARRVAASLGFAELEVAPSLRVAILTTGDELVPPGQPLGAGQIYASNGALLYGVNNRGGLTALRHLNYAPGSNRPIDEAHAGDGFLMRHGFTLVWSGWDGELLPAPNRLRLYPPLASESDPPVTGLVRCEIVPAADTGDREWERNLRLDYTLQSGLFKDLGVSLRHASLRSDAARDEDQLRVYLTYNFVLL